MSNAECRMMKERQRQRKTANGECQMMKERTAEWRLNCVQLPMTESPIPNELGTWVSGTVERWERRHSRSPVFPSSRHPVFSSCQQIVLSLRAVHRPVRESSCQKNVQIARSRDRANQRGGPPFGIPPAPRGASGTAALAPCWPRRNGSGNGNDNGNSNGIKRQNGKTVLRQWPRGTSAQVGVAVAGDEPGAVRRPAVSWRRSRSCRPG